MSQNDVQMWAFLVGLCIFVGLVMALFMVRRMRERAAPPHPPDQPDITTERRSEAIPRGAGAETVGRRPTPASAAEPDRAMAELGVGMRGLLLQAIAERAPAGWSALALCPPPHAERMTWHVHLDPDVALDLRDGRSVPVSAPAASHEWQLAGGRTAAVADGDPAPPPTDETVNIRVTGPYLAVEINREADGREMLTARVLGEAADELPRPRAVASDVRAVQGALREAVALAVSSKMLGPAPAVGYRPASWTAHERVWLTISR